MSDSEAQLAIIRELLGQAIPSTLDTSKHHESYLSIRNIGSIAVSSTTDLSDLSSPLLFGDTAVFIGATETVALPISEQKQPEVKAVKQTSIDQRSFRKKHSFLFYGSALLVIVGVASPASSLLDRMTESTSRSDSVATNPVEIDASTPMTVDVDSTITSEVTVSDTTIAPTETTVVETPIVETTVAPRQPTLLEAVNSGQYRLEDIPGSLVGTLSIEGICLDGIDVSVVSAVDPVTHPEIMDGFDWSALNTDPSLPDVQVGDLQGARERLNPLYKLRLDDTPQQACEMPGQSEYEPRWVRSTAGSQAAKNMADTPAELVPQASIHPYSVLPGQIGVTYIAGHRTTEAAPFLNNDALLPGQTAQFSDGFNIYDYVFQGFESVDPDINIADILSKTRDGKNTLIVSTCDDGDDQRLLAIFVQVG